MCRRRTPVLLAVAALALVAGCGEDPVVPADELPSALRLPSVSTGGWVRVERPGFSFLIPPGFHDLGLRPIDSDAAAYERPWDGASLHHDYGAYSAPVSVPSGAGEVRRVRTRIGGRVATLVAYRADGAWTVGVSWERLGRSGAGVVGLTLAGIAPTDAARDEILAAVHSVRFP